MNYSRSHPSREVKPTISSVSLRVNLRHVLSALNVKRGFFFLKRTVMAIQIQFICCFLSNSNLSLMLKLILVELQNCSLFICAIQPKRRKTRQKTNLFLVGNCEVFLILTLIFISIYFFCLFVSRDYKKNNI